MASPRPVPPYLRVVEPSACWNASNSVGWASAAMPMPSSLTFRESIGTPARMPSSSTSSSMRPFSVNLTALPTRLVSTCHSRCSSPVSQGGTSAATRAIRRLPRRSAATCCGLTTRSISPATAKGAVSSSRRPASIFEKSRISLTMRSSVSPLLRTSVSRSRWSAVRSESSTTPVNPRIPFMGVRISWLMFARNSLLARLADRASWLATASSAARRSSSAPLRRLDHSSAWK